MISYKVPCNFIIFPFTSFSSEHSRKQIIDSEGIYSCPSYLALSWQTVAVFAGGVIQHQTSPPHLLYMATQTTEQTQIRSHEGNIKNVTVFLEELVFPHCDLLCSGCCPALCTVDGPPPSCPQCTSVLGLNWQTKPGADGR